MYCGWEDVSERFLVGVQLTDISHHTLDPLPKSVDWWFTYKLPGGFTFAYADENTDIKTKPLQLFSRNLDDKNPVALTRTLQSIAGKTDTEDVADVAADAGADAALRRLRGTSAAPYLMYNDQPGTYLSHLSCSVDMPAVPVLSMPPLVTEHLLESPSSALPHAHTHTPTRMHVCVHTPAHNRCCCLMLMRT